METNETKIRRLWKEEAKKMGNGLNDPLSASTLLSNMEEYMIFRTRAEKRHLSSVVDFRGKELLDIGCGPGRLSFWFARICNSVIGIDVSKEFIDYANQRMLKEKFNNLEFKVMSTFEIEFDKKFDIIFIGGVLLYLTDSEINHLLNLLRQFLLNKDGIIIIREPISYFDKNVDDGLDVKRTENSYLGLFRKARYELIYSNETFMHSPFYRIYGRIPEKSRNFFPIKYLFRFLFSMNLFVDRFFLHAGPKYKTWASRKWTVKQKFLIFKTN
jgi:2-polyprenyl-3-methyl-5-hydroxy-6-metoxy-1,4-benzoquinol methylase